MIVSSQVALRRSWARRATFLQARRLLSERKATVGSKDSEGRRRISGRPRAPSPGSTISYQTLSRWCARYAAELGQRCAARLVRVYRPGDLPRSARCTRQACSCSVWFGQASRLPKAPPPAPAGRRSGSLHARRNLLWPEVKGCRPRDSAVPTASRSVRGGSLVPAEADLVSRLARAMPFSHSRASCRACFSAVSTDSLRGRNQSCI